MLGVFLVSAVVHEYIFCFVLGFFYPVMLMLFLVFGGECNLCGPTWEAVVGGGLVAPETLRWGGLGGDACGGLGRQ